MNINEFNVNEFDIRGSQNRNPSDTRGLCRPLGDATFAGRRNRGSPHCGRPSTVRRTDSSGRRIDDAAAFPSGRRSLRSHKKVCREESADFWHLRRSHSSCRSEEHTSELQSHSFISYAVFCLKKTQKHTEPHERRRQTLRCANPHRGTTL